MFEAGAGDVLEVEVGEVEVHRGAGVLVGEVDAGDAFVIGGEGDGNAGGTIERQRMPGRVDAEDDVVGGEVDLDHDVAGGHLFQQSSGDRSRT